MRYCRSVMTNHSSSNASSNLSEIGCICLLKLSSRDIRSTEFQGEIAGSISI